MFDTLEAIKALIGVEVESVSLEFKDGIKLNGLSDRARTELVTDVTAFANAGGGTLIYGISEESRAGQSYAGAISPVTDAAVTQDRLRDIIYSNTDPTLRDFTIATIPFDGHSIFVITVDEGNTAYQNKRDQKFYCRVDASAHPMYAFAIRDVMNRRSRPHLSANLAIQSLQTSPDRHLYMLVPELKNTGNLTANHWVLRIGIPPTVARVGVQAREYVRTLGESREGAHRAAWFEFSSDRTAPDSGRILPGDTYVLGQAQGFPQIQLLLEGESAHRVHAFEPPLFWMLLVDDAPAQRGETPYRGWSQW